MDALVDAAVSPVGHALVMLLPVADGVIDEGASSSWNAGAGEVEPVWAALSCCRSSSDSRTKIAFGGAGYGSALMLDEDC